MSFAISRLERIYLQVQTAYGTIPNAAGVASVGNANACRFIKAVLDNDVATIKRTDKTGSRSATAGQAGRKFAKWSVEQSLAPNGVAGTIPDCDPILQGLFGQAGSVTTATVGNGFPAGTDVLSGAACVKYALSDNIIPFALWSFRQPSTVDQRVAFGCGVDRTSFQLGQEGLATWSAEGEAKWVLSSNQYAVASDEMKGSLSAFPTEPSAPVTNGGGIVGFTGKALVNAVAMATIRSANVSIGPGNQQVKDTFGSWHPSELEGDERAVSTSFSLYEDDTAAFKTLIEVAQNKTAITNVYQLGTIPGSMVVIEVKGIQLVAPSREEQRRFICNFPDSPASGSSLSAKDEVTIWFC